MKKEVVIFVGGHTGGDHIQKLFESRLNEAGYHVFENGDVVILDEARHLPALNVQQMGRVLREHTGLREKLRAMRQGLHNTPDGRIERCKGMRVQRGWGGYVAYNGHNRQVMGRQGFGDTRAEAIRAYRDLFLHPEAKP